MGYRPNPYAAALSTGWQTKDAREMPLAIVRWPSKDGALYPSEEVMGGIEPRAVELGYRVERCDLSSLRELSKCLRLLYNRGIQGVFIAPVGDMQEALTLDWSRFCVMACGRYNTHTPFNTVRPEIFESTRSVMLRAAGYGYKRIGAALFRHEPPMIDDYARLAAIQCGLVNPGDGIELHEILLSKPEKDDHLGKWVVEKRLDAVIVFSVGQYHRLVEQGIRVSELGVATLHYHDDLYSRHISGMDQQYFEIGCAAANHMDFMIRHHERGIPAVPRHLVIESKWREGTTLQRATRKLRSTRPSKKP